MEDYFEKVNKEIMDMTEISFMGDDHKDGVYIRFPMWKGWMNKRNYLVDDNLVKNHIKKLMVESFGIPRKNVTDVYENYYRTDLLNKILKP